jgi:teichoic acid glycerol-phosphate primase
MKEKSQAGAPKTRPAGLIFDSSSHYLDHLAPFCALLGWPLIIVDPLIREMAKRFYPDLKIVESSTFEIEKLVCSFSHLATCATRPLLQASIGPTSCRTVWLPHGNSDKGKISPHFEALQKEELALVYGQKMVDFLKEKNVDIPVVRIGSFRHLYYQKWRSFYDALPIGAFSKKQPTVLYAPTWEDSENNCSFWDAFPRIAENLPDSINLLVKLHPNTIGRHAPRIERLIGKYESGHLQFLLNFPPIYLLLNRCDYYLGDASSIGYDFLQFDRPLFFLDPRGRDLSRCGKIVTPESFYQSLMEKDLFSSLRQEMHAYTFDKMSAAKLKRTIRDRL